MEMPIRAIRAIATLWASAAKLKQDRLHLLMEAKGWLSLSLTPESPRQGDHSFDGLGNELGLAWVGPPLSMGARGGKSKGPSLAKGKCSSLS